MTKLIEEQKRINDEWWRELRKSKRSKSADWVWT